MSNVSYILNGYAAGLSRALGKTVTLPEPTGAGYELSVEHRICPGINTLTQLVVPRALENAGFVADAASLRRHYKGEQDKALALSFDSPPVEFSRKLKSIIDLAQGILKSANDRPDLSSTAAGAQLIAVASEWKKAAESAERYQVKAAAKDKEGVIAAITSLGVAVGTGLGSVQPTDQLIAVVTKDLARQGGHFSPAKRAHPAAHKPHKSQTAAYKHKELRRAEHKEARMLAFVNIMKREALHGVKSPTQKQREAIHGMKRRFGVN